MKKYRILSFCLALTVAFLSVPLVVSKANDNIDTNTITEYVDKDGDGYVEVDSLYSDFPVTSQTVTDEGIVVTCYDVPTTFSADATSNWYIDNIYICKGGSGYPVSIIEGPFKGAFSVSLPYNGQGEYYYILFHNDFWKDGVIGEHNFNYDFTFVAACESLGSLSCAAMPRSLYSSSAPISNRNCYKTDDLFSDTYNIKYDHTTSNFYNEFYYQVSIPNPSASIGRYVVDFTCYANLEVTDLDGIEVEVDS